MGWTRLDWVGLGWVGLVFGLCWVRLDLDELGWVGLGRVGLRWIRLVLFWYEMG